MKRKYLRLPFGKKENRVTVVLCRKPMQRGLVGMVRGKAVGRDIPIVMDTTPADQMEYEYAALCSLGNGLGVIQLTPGVVVGIRSGDPFARTCLFHELGHFLKRHLLVPGFQSDEYDRKRYRIASEGGILSQEVEADAIAGEYIGVKTVAAGLGAIRDLQREKLGTPAYNREEVEVSIRELENRIRMLLEGQ